MAVIASGQLPIRRAPVAPAAILAAVLAVAEVQARKKRIACVVESPDLPEILVDGPKLEQVVGNLIANAIEHSPPGSTVSLERRSA